MIPHMKAKMIFIGKKQKTFFFEKPKYQIQKWSFLIYTNIQFTIMEQFLQFKACKAGKIDALGIEVAQQMKLSGCSTKGFFTPKMSFLALLLVK